MKNIQVKCEQNAQRFIRLLLNQIPFYSYRNTRLIWTKLAEKRK
jgi:hypothetical protein